MFLLLSALLLSSLAAGAATPIQALNCLAVDLAVTVAHQQQAATSFCSSYLCEFAVEISIDAPTIADAHDDSNRDRLHNNYKYNNDVSISDRCNPLVEFKIAMHCLAICSMLTID